MVDILTSIRTRRLHNWHNKNLPSPEPMPEVCVQMRRTELLVFSRLSTAQSVVRPSVCTSAFVWLFLPKYINETPEGRIY